MPEQYDADFAPPLAHLAEQAPVSISGVQGFKNAKKDGTVANASTRGGLNFVTGSNITLTVADDSASDEVDVTIAAADAEYNVLTKVTTPVTVASTVTDTNLVSYSVPANTHGTDKEVVLRLGGDWKQNSGGNVDIPLFSVKLGSGPTTVLKNALVAANVCLDSATRFPWHLEVRWQATGATSTQWVTLGGRIGHGANAGGTSAFGTGEGRAVASSSGGMTFLEGGAAATIDTTAAANLIVSVILPANSANCDMVMKYASVAVIG